MRNLAAGACLLGGLIVACGCREDVRLAGQDVRTVNVKIVTHYGITLDREAPPEHVAYVLLRAIHDDFLAPGESERRAALDIQFDVSAASVIKGRNRTAHNDDEFLHSVVWRCTPTVSHYVGDFETDRDKALARLVRVAVKKEAGDASGEACEMRMEVDGPSNDPNARVVLTVGLVRDDGYWRVLRVGFVPAKRSIAKSAKRAKGAKGAKGG